METYQKIDTHSHFGATYLGPKNKIEDYILPAKKIGIKACIASPGPSPEFTTNNQLYNPCLWVKNRDGIIYVQQKRDVLGNILKTETAKDNPYHDSNIALFHQSARENRFTILVMPIYHPILDSAKELESMLIKYPSVALKIHGVATFTGPKNISLHAIDLIKKSKKPLVIHTDTSLKKPETALMQICKINNPIDWAMWAKDTRIPTVLAHGARLSEKAIQIAESTPNIMLGIAPDLLIMEEPNRLAITTDDYLKDLLSLIPPSKLLFDIDFGWNVKKRNNWENRDWQMHKRIEKTTKNLKIDNKKLEQIFCNNAINFFSL